jgi:DNA/RNA endonuclease G (NUC1)
MSNSSRRFARQIESIPSFIGIAAVTVAVGLSNLGPALLALTNGGSITTLGVPLTEGFDTLATTGTGIAWSDSTTIPGWYSTRVTYNAGTGSSNTGAFYSFGVAGTNPVTDRALGSVGSSGTGTVYWGVKLTNNTGTTITSLDITYFGEQWRNGGATSPNVSVAQTADFQYQVANAGIITAVNTPSTGWTDHDPLDFTSPTFGTSASAALDGNAAANRVQKSATLSVTIADGQEVWLRWVDIDHPGNDHGLAIDDLSVIANGVPPGDSAPSVTSTTPANSAIDVAVDSTVVINFSESVSAAAGSFSLQCPAGAPQTVSQSASPGNSFTLTPASALPHSTTCTVTVAAGLIADTDTNDPPDQMASDFAFSFATASPIDAAPTVNSTTPPDSASNIGVNSSVVVNFSESVAASASAFTLECGSPQAFAQSSSPATSFTLTPVSSLPFATTCTVTVIAGEITDTDTNDPPDQMASDVTFSFMTANPPPPVATNVIINEVDADTPGADTAEFVELYDGGVGNTTLDGLVLVLFNGNGDVSYGAFDLDGFSTDANGYFTIGNPGVPGVDLIVDPGAAGALQNGADAVALYVGNATDFPSNTPLTTANLQDAVAYDTDDPDDVGLLALLNAGQSQVNENGGGNGATQSSQRCPNGTGGARNTSTYLQGSPTPDGANSCPPPPQPSNSVVVISQLYGGGGNAGATYQNDYVELYNRGVATVDLSGWSLQYASATGSGWDFGKQPLGGAIAPGEYFLISLASSGAIGLPLPPANISGQINMSGANGKVALVNSFDGLVGNCPTSDPHVMDFVGYGSADCREGTATAPPGSNTIALFRQGNGSTDTDNNGSDFVAGSPMPRQTAPIVELGPLVLSTDPRTSGANAPRDATIQVTFTEPVDVIGGWFDISCVSSGSHNSATLAGGGQNHYITPNDNFVAGEQCTVTIFKDQIHDLDLDDSGPNTDTLPANYVWSFTVATGTAPPYPASVHLTMGNPSGAVADTGQPNNFLMEKPEFALSYSSDLGRPNWVSWHLADEWIGTLTRVDTFRADPEVPAAWYRVQSFDFTGSGFDRGHMTPNADRDKETSIPINQATFLMTNMVAQAPDNNQGPWAEFEGYLRTLLPSDEVYIVAGGVGVGGSGSNGGLTMTIADGHVSVPAYTWKVALVIPKDSGDDISRVTCSSRTIAIVMPNTQGIRTDPWENFLTTVDAVESLTGYDLFSTLPPAIQACVEAGTNGSNPPLDTIPPSVSCASADGLWHADNVTLGCTANDSGSGLADAGDASFSLVTAVAVGTENMNASTNSHLVCDVAGNCTTAVISGNKIDRKGPVITLTTPASGAVYQLNQIVNASYTCADSGSGPSGCTGTVANLSAINTSTAGVKNFVVSATDVVGNISSTMVSYQVKRSLTTVGPAKVWVGLKNSDDVGLKLDLRAELLVNGVVAASGDLNGIAAVSSGFNNAILNSVAMSMASGPVDVPAGAQVMVRISTRRTCLNSGNGHSSGTAREWYNGLVVDSGASRDAGSRIQFTLGGMTSTYFLRNAFGLDTVAGTSRLSADAFVNSSAACPARPFVLFGTWSAVVP